MIVENPTTEIMTSELSTTSLSRKKVRSPVKISDQSAKMRPHSVVSESNAYFAVPKTVTWGSKTHQPKTGMQFHKTSDGPPKNFKPNSSIKSFVPEKTSTPNTSIARPKPVNSQHMKQRQTPKSSFTIYTEPAKQTTTPSCRPLSVSLYTPKNILSTLSTNTLPSSSRSFLPVKLKKDGKVTSPLCECGRRAKRQVVSNGGPNQGRAFYCCPVRRSGSGGRIQKGCNFFKWETSLTKSSTVACPAVRSSVSLCQIDSTLNYHLQQSSKLRKSY